MGAVCQEPILKGEDLTEDILQKLFRDEVCVVRIPNFCSPEALVSIRKFIQSSQEKFIKSYYVGYKDKKPVKKFYGVNLLGTPFNSTYHHPLDDDTFIKYYQEAVPYMQSFRKALAPYASPIDRLRLQLDEHWPYGARIGMFHKGKNMLVGIYRFIYAEDSFLGEVQPHFDSLPKDIQDLEKQYSANIYMDVPKSGGELEIWNVDPLSPFNIVQTNTEKNWRAILPPPIVVKPKACELILFNTRRPHAVRGFKAGIRSSLQCFIGMYKDKSLEFWS